MGGELTTFIKRNHLQRMPGFFLHHSVPSMKPVEGLIFRRKKINVGESTEVVNEEEKIGGTSKRDNRHRSTQRSRWTTDNGIVA